MSKRGIDFATGWISENVNAGPYLEENDPQLAILANELEVAAQAEGISRNDIEEDMGSLEDVIAQALESATDDEVARLAAKDD